MRKAPEFDAYVDSYSEEINNALAFFGSEHRFFTANKAEILGGIFSSIGSDPSSLKVLDAGCGIGLVHPLISGSVGELHGLEISLSSLEIARQQNPDVHYTSYEGGTFPYEDETFDCAYAICVLHHVPKAQWPSFMAEMHRVVKKRGVVVIIEHNPLNPATQWIVNTCPIDKDAHLVAPWRMRALMKAVGLRSKLHYILFTPLERRVFRKLDHLLRFVPLGAQYVAMGRRIDAESSPLTR